MLQGSHQGRRGVSATFDRVRNTLYPPRLNTVTERINGKIQELKTVGRDSKKFENLGCLILVFRGWLTFAHRIRDKTRFFRAIDA